MTRRTVGDARPVLGGAWLGGYTGWVIGRVIPGTQPPRSQLLEEQTPSEAGPVAPAGGGVGGVCSGRTGTGPVYAVLTTHSSLAGFRDPLRCQAC